MHFFFFKRLCKDCGLTHMPAICPRRHEGVFQAYADRVVTRFDVFAF